MRIYRGFTLLELMVAVAIAGVMLSVVIPGFFGLMERNNIAATSNEIVSALLYARSEAVRIENDVTFTPEDDGWLVTSPGNIDIVDQTVENENISIAENIAANDVTYNSRGRADITLGDSIDISFNGELRSRVCLSLTGRPYIKSVAEGNCP
ncbi:MAG: GspH/FimT family pseudopilin [Candidatus Thiodiazotropha endolucinida]